MTKRLLCLLVLAAALRAPADTAITPVPPAADFRVATVQVRIAPDHRDWTYRPGENAKFRIMVTADNTPVDNAVVTYSVGPEMMPAEKKTVPVPPEGLVIDGGTLNTGGFIRCKASVEFAGRTYQGVATAAFAPEAIQPYQTDPADFDAFWAKGKEELAKVPLEARLTLLPEACTDKVNVYHVNFRTVNQAWNPQPPRIYGILCEPKAPGKYPAVLKVPGAGVRSYAGDPELAARGAIVLEIGIHGVPVNMAKEVYDAMFGGALHSYWLNKLDDKDAYYYRRVYLGCVRANDFLASREMWNGKDMLVMGASQGGLLSLVTAALDPRVTALAVTHPAMCDVVAPLHGRAGGWPHPFRPADDGTPSIHATPAKIATSAYYDAVNFARRVKVPGFYIWGFNDETCPPTSMHAAYNVITAPKTLALQPEQAHTYPVEQWEATNRWVLRTLRLP
jgi:cephalosporin-C deacetylase